MKRERKIKPETEEDEIMVTDEDFLLIQAVRDVRDELKKLNKNIAKI